MPPGDGSCAIGKTKWRTAMKFNVGDRVSHAGFGDGVIVEKDDTSIPYLVRFDNRNVMLHDDLGRMETKNHWWCEADNLTPLAAFKVGDIVDHASIHMCRGGKITMAHNNNTYSVVWPNSFGECRDPASALSPNTDHIVILRENGVLKPAHRPFIHADEFAAAKEARRLAELHPGCTFEIWARVGGNRGTVKERTAVEKSTVVEVVE